MRIATIDDISELVTLRMEFLESTDEILREQNYLYFSQHLGKDLFAAIIPGESCIILQIMQAPPNTWALYSRYGLIVGVYTRPMYRHKGNLHSLMKLILDIAKEKNLEYIELQSTTVAQNTYADFGFEPGGYSKYTYMKKIL